VNRLGTEYANYVQRGEAFAHALANVLRTPILTHDTSAIAVLKSRGEVLSDPFLRAFDLLALAVQLGKMNYSDCAKSRQAMMKRGERVLPCFANCSFEDGLPKFYQRIVDSTLAPIGASVPIDSWDTRIHVTRVLSIGVSIT
jgi:hypothetical protein